LHAISDDGRFVAFQSEYENLVAQDTNAKPDVFVRDRQTGATERVSVTDAGAEAQFGALASNPTRIGISADGRFVTFTSGSPDLVPGLSGFNDRVFVRDRQQQRTELITVRTDGTFDYYVSGFGPSISADGRFVAFESGSNTLVPGDTNAVHDIFVRDRQLGTTERVSLTGAGPRRRAPRTSSTAATAIR
jgi:Tol biopolymer transport system component